MGVYIDLNKTVIINFGFDLPKSFEEHLEHEIDSIIRRNGFLAEQRIKTRLTNYCLNISMETIFMNTENSKTNEPHKLFITCYKD